MSEAATLVASAPAQEPCDCCGANDWRPLLTAWPVQKCRGCGQVVAQDRYAGLKLPDLYGEEFAGAAVHPTYTFDGQAGHIRDELLWRRRLERMQGYRESGRLLDVGCSVGALMNLARQMGWAPQGVETSAWACDFTRAHYQLPVHCGLLQEGVFEDGSFDAVISSHTLEHVPKPRNLLRQFLRVLRPGGVALIVVPTQFASLTYRWWAKPSGEPPPRHVQFYYRTTMCRLLRASGFQVARVEVNLQLAYLAQLATGSKQVRASMERRSDQLNAAPGGGAGAWATRRVKALCNLAAKWGDFGDELTVYAVKPPASAARAAGAASGS